MTDLGPAACARSYRALRERVSAMVRATDPDALDRIAPATPAWRVRDVLAHMVGVNADICSGTLDGVATDAWTEAQVRARRDVPIDALLDEWVECATTVEANAAMLGSAAGQWVYDAATHEHDIRHAIGVPGARESDAIAIAFEWATDRLAEILDHEGHAGIVLHTEAQTKRVGAVEPVSTVRTTRFEIVRAMTGRRSRAQIESYDWDGDARPEHVLLGIFALRTDDLDE